MTGILTENVIALNREQNYLVQSSRKLGFAVYGLGLAMQVLAWPSFWPQSRRDHLRRTPFPDP